DEVRKEVGEEVFKAVRRGYETSPPALRKDDERSPFFDPKYRSLDPSLIPLGESLKDTRRRVVNYFFEKIAPFLVSETTVLITAHGNSLRALVMYIENISKEEISKVEIPTARPILYEFDKELNPLFRKDF
ncbi:MAG: 2,3-bisphosphoglycerate-dependent phosphoglycerate mutase, partial [Epsilonproteobacteria bacterium]|nr:2,3-bisphosphoglycerate-dependent phosphoglycerate mutase [Campylobacterota bacterium]